ncbi:response regulator transcription factor [Pseudomonas japonica]|uniref:response regulator transcription factor n=1 Tax=Pseudomonas japonica TaxID=256466 RepID=UPI0015E48A80|nr:response regulator transcription factor [Pseudomonas japonica]MBA1242455.1 response regulator transcription factor [Pseudomonas japonica]
MKANSVRTRLMLLDDHEFILHGISQILARHPDVEVISTHTESRTLLEALRIMPVDMVVMDYALSPGEVDGLNLIKAIRTRHPRTRVIVISSLHTPSTVALTLRCGAAGFVGKELGAEELLKAIRVVSNGRVYLHPDMEDALQRNNVAVHPLGPTEEVDEPVAALVNTTTLTLREREVLRCCLDGLSVTDISSKFSRSIKTISAQKQSAYRKLGLRTDHELFKLRALLERR